MSDKNVYFSDDLEIDLDDFVEGEEEEATNPMLRTLTIIGDKWNILLITYMIVKGPKTFLELLEKFTELNDAALKGKLERLEEGGTIEQVDEDGEIRYTVTESGNQLKPLLAEMKDWGKKSSVKASKGKSIKMGKGRTVKSTQNKIKVR